MVVSIAMSLSSAGCCVLIDHFRTRRINGKHYARTCEDWLKKQDRNQRKSNTIQSLRKDAEKKGVDPLEGEKTFYKFRVFYLACAEFFATNDGEEWGVGHYLFTKRD